MDWEFDAAVDGNIALDGELDIARGHEFVLGLAFGDSLHNALTTLFQSLGFPFADQQKRFVEQWTRARRTIEPLAALSTDGGRLRSEERRVGKEGRWRWSADTEPEERS